MTKSAVVIAGKIGTVEEIAVEIGTAAGTGIAIGIAMRRPHPLPQAGKADASRFSRDQKFSHAFSL